MTPDPFTISHRNTGNRSSDSERQSSNWDIRNAPRNYASLVAFQVVSAFFSFAAVWIITRHLGSEGYGGIVAIIAASQVAQVFVNWTSAAVVRFGVDEFLETQKIARTFWVRLIVVALNLVLILLLKDLWYPPLEAWLRLSPGLFWVVAVHISATVLWIHLQMSLQAAKLPRTQGLLMMVERLLIFAGLVSLTAAANLTPFWAIACYIAAASAMFFLGTFKLRKYIFVRFSIDREFIKRVILYSAPLAPMALVGYFSGSYLDAIFVSKFLSIKDLGIYSVASQINGIVLQLPTLANSLLILLFITLQKEEQPSKIERFFRDLLPSCVLLAGMGYILIAFCCWFLIPLVFGAEFARSVPALWILLAAAATALPVFIGYSAVAQAKSATLILMVAAILAAAGNIIFNFILIPRFGLIGCAWATVAACFIGSFAYALLLKRRFKIAISWVFPAMIPAVGSAAIFAETESIFWSLLFCVLSTSVLAIFHRASIRDAVTFIKNFRRSPTLAAQ